MALGNLADLQAGMNNGWNWNVNNYQSGLTPEMMAIIGRMGGTGIASPDGGYQVDRTMQRSGWVGDGESGHWAESPMYSVRGVNQNSDDTGLIYRYDKDGKFLKVDRSADQSATDIGGLLAVATLGVGGALGAFGGMAADAGAAGAAGAGGVSGLASGADLAAMYGGLDGAATLGGGASVAGGSSLGALGAGVSGLSSGADLAAMYGGLDGGATLGGGASVGGGAALGGGTSAMGAGSGSWLDGLKSGASSLFSGGSGGAGDTGGFNWGSLIQPAISAIGGAYSANQTDKAAEAQLQAAREAQAQFKPWIENGGWGMNQLGTMLGRNGADAAKAAFQQDPGYQFRLDQGNKALTRAASASGGMGSGKFLKDAMSYNQGMASQEFGNATNRLLGIAGMGQTATNSTADLTTQAGNARAGGIMGSSNALLGGIGQGLSMYNNNQANAQNQQFQNALMTKFLSKGVS